MAKKLKIDGKPHDKKKERQIKLVVISMVFILALVLTFYIISISLKKFEYAGLKFAKEKIGALNLYYTEFPLRNITGDVVSSISFYFKEDPRKLKSIEINGGKIVLMNDVAVAGNSKAMTCEDSMVAATTLALFLKGAGLNPFTGTTNMSLAKGYNITYVECSNPKGYSLVLFEKGNQSIIKKSGNCYTLSFNNCEIMNVTEKFMLGVYAHSRDIEI